MSITRFTPENTAIVLIDHQVGTMGWVRSTPFDGMREKALALAKAAKALDMPLILTTSLEEHAQGLLLAPSTPEHASTACPTTENNPNAA
jgi:nicotinamidase-related amidase